MSNAKRIFSFALLVSAVVAAGIDSLIYEVLWIRQLGFALGSTAVATSIMLTAFLGGLALGSVLMARIADRINPFKAIAIVELVASVTGLASIPILAYVGRAYVFIATATGVTGFWAMVIRAVFVLVVMAIPATLFGMTFPLATAGGAKLVGGSTAAGVISAASSFGSAIGAVLCGLWLEPTFGLLSSAMVGACLNVVSACLVGAVWWMGRKRDTLLANSGFINSKASMKP